MVLEATAILLVTYKCMLAGQFFRESLLGSLIMCTWVQDHPRWSHLSGSWLGQDTSILFCVAPPSEQPWFLMWWRQHSKGQAPKPKHLPSPVRFLSFIRHSESHDHLQYQCSSKRASHSTNLIEQNLLKIVYRGMGRINNKQ